MATPDGKVTFEAAGVTHTLQFTTNALCMLEEKLGKTTVEIATEMHFNPGIVTTRAMFWAALGDHSKTLAQIGDLIDQVGPLKATNLAKAAYAAAFPELQEEAGEANPPPAAAG